MLYHEKVYDYLVQAQKDLDQRKVLESELEKAVSENDLPGFARALEKRGTPSITILFLIAQSNRIEMAKLLKTALMNFNEQEDEAFCRAASFGALDVARFLRKEGADARAQADTPLCNAVYYNKIPMVDYLAQQIFADERWMGSSPQDLQRQMSQLADLLKNHSPLNSNIPTDAHILAGAISILEKYALPLHARLRQAAAPALPFIAPVAAPSLKL